MNNPFRRSSELNNKLAILEEKAASIGESLNRISDDISVLEKQVLSVEEKKVRAKKNDVSDVNRKKDSSSNAPTKKQKRNRHIRAVMEKTGWDRRYTIEQMNAAKKEVGCGSFVYSYYGYYNMTLDEQKSAYAEWQKKQERKKKENQRRMKNCIAEAMQATGWDEEYTRKQVEYTIQRTGCTAEEYREYRFWSLDESEQNAFFLMCHTDILRHKFNVDLNMNRLIVNKRIANLHFAKYIDRRWCANRNVSFEEFKKTFAGCEKLFYKPEASFGGQGAQALDYSEENAETLYQQLMDMPEGVVEEFVVQHPEMSRMSPRVLNTIRMSSISSHDAIDGDGNHFAIPYAMLKMGGSKGCVDNLREGGVGAAIDLDTGKLCTDAVDVNLNTYTHHPVTGVEVNGFQVPFFAEAKAMVKRVVEENDLQGYFAWDIAITKRGPMLIEINGRPSSTLLELPFYNTPLRGRKCVIEKYL